LCHKGLALHLSRMIAKQSHKNVGFLPHKPT
jgi:hypothetical protein